jgi:hypothetical protein
MITGVLLMISGGAVSHSDERSGPAFTFGGWTQLLISVAEVMPRLLASRDRLSPKTRSFQCAAVDGHEDGRAGTH